MKRTRSVLDAAPGLVRFAFHGRVQERAIAHRFLRVGFDCFQGPEEIAIHSLELEGTP